MALPVLCTRGSTRIVRQLRNLEITSWLFLHNPGSLCWSCLQMTKPPKTTVTMHFHFLHHTNHGLLPVNACVSQTKLFGGAGTTECMLNLNITVIGNAPQSLPVITVNCFTVEVLLTVTCSPHLHSDQNKHQEIRISQRGELQAGAARRDPGRDPSPAALAGPPWRWSSC